MDTSQPEYLTLDDFRRMSNQEFDCLFPTARAVELQLLRAGRRATTEQQQSQPEGTPSATPR
jgi:hypothetical protein